MRTWMILASLLVSMATLGNNRADFLKKRAAFELRDCGGAL